MRALRDSCQRVERTFLVSEQFHKLHQHVIRRHAIRRCRCLIMSTTVLVVLCFSFPVLRVVEFAFMSSGGGVPGAGSGAVGPC